MVQPLVRAWKKNARTTVLPRKSLSLSGPAGPAAVAPGSVKSGAVSPTAGGAAAGAAWARSASPGANVTAANAAALPNRLIPPPFGSSFHDPPDLAVLVG